MKKAGFNIITLTVLVLLVAVTMCGCSLSGLGQEESGSDSAEHFGFGTETAPPAVSGSESTVTDPETNRKEITGELKVESTDGKYSSEGATLTISSAGTYTFSGKVDDGMIVVSAPETDEVTLVLSGLSASCSFNSPLFFKSADKVKLVVAEGSFNEIIDARPVLTAEDDAQGSAAVYAECDLSISGTGSLVVSAGYNNGIHSKDDLKIKEASIKVTAPDNALKGNDSLTVESGSLILISTSGDGIRTSNSDVSKKGNQRGTVTISGGVLEIYAGCDGIDASYDAVISGDAVITINTNSYSPYTDESLLGQATQQSQNQQGQYQLTGAWPGSRPGGGGGGGFSGGFPGMEPGGSNMSNRASESAKGIKADNEIKITGGVITANCRDDGIHANADVALENGQNPLGNITITGGTITLSVTDDGIHADGTLLIGGGTVKVVNSYEGLEGHLINIEGGEVNVFATDDGINAQSSGGRTSDGLITVSGGRVFVEVEGRDVDGFDSNGSYRQTGGIVVVSNPGANSQGTSASVDADGSVSVTGGTIIALGTVPSGGGGRFGIGGMSSSLVPSGAVTFSGSLGAGSHSFSYGDLNVDFTLRSAVNSGWIWSEGITKNNYSLK